MDKNSARHGAPKRRLRPVVAELVGQTCTHNLATTTNMAVNMDVATTKAKPQQLTDWNRAQTKKAAQSKARKPQKRRAATTTTKQKPIKINKNKINRPAYRMHSPEKGFPTLYQYANGMHTFQMQTGKQ